MPKCDNCGNEGEHGADGPTGMNWVDDTWVCNSCMSDHVGSGGSPWESPARDNGR